MEAFKDFIQPELLVLIPVLYFIGVALKNSKTIADRYIPILLGVVGVFLALLYVVSTSPVDGLSGILQAVFAAATQGILCAGASVYVNQLIKQTGKDN